MSKISRFTGKVVTLAKSAVGGRGEAAAPQGGGGFADYAVVSLHCLRIYLEKSYREALDLLGEMPQILAEIGLVMIQGRFETYYSILETGDLYE
ncbi:hypothetical protein JCM18750_22590 [Halostagnicola bangensis]